MIYLIVPDESSAQVLKQAYELKLQSRRPFALYQGDKHALIVSGEGKALTAAATAHLLKSCKANDLLIHIAIEEGLNTPAYLVDHCHDVDIGESTYPSLPFELPYPSRSLNSGEGQPDRNAAGFFTAALRYLDPEWVHCLRFQALTGPSITLINQLCAGLLELRETLPAEADTLERLAPFLAEWKFSTTQQEQLKRLLQRWEILSGETAPWHTHWETLETFLHRRAVLSGIERLVDALPVIFGERPLHQPRKFSLT